MTVSTPQSAAVGTAIDKDDLFIPLIDFGQYLHGDATQKAAVAAGMVAGFKTAGFLYLKNHGIPTESTNRVFSESAKFFARPQKQKDELGWYAPEANRGYVAKGREKVTQITDKAAVEALRGQSPDQKESIEIGRDDVPAYPNCWPDRFDAEGKVFRETMSGFFTTCTELHMSIMRAIALGMGLEEQFFDEFTDAGDNTLRLLHYPAVKKEAWRKTPDMVRAGKHTDYGSLTLLFQDDRGGLQVRSPQNTWVNATPIPGTVVINAGDLLARWSNDAIKSTEHRVVEPPVETEEEAYPPRYSVPFFCNPNFDKLIEALPGTYGEGVEKKYPPVNSGEYLTQRLASTYS